MDTDLIQLIDNGELDTHLELIQEAISSRKAQLRRTKAVAAGTADFATGYLQDIEPSYLHGAPVAIIRHQLGGLVVKLDAKWLTENPRARHLGVYLTVKQGMFTTTRPETKVPA